MSERDVRSELVGRLNRIVNRLPTGLLHRLVEDAQFFHEWNMGKKRARASARLAQYRPFRPRSPK